MVGMLLTGARAAVEVKVLDGAPNASLKSTIESKASNFMTEAYNAYQAGRDLNLSGLVAPDAVASIQMLWENVHFRPEDSYVEEVLLNSSDGYQIRNIPLIIKPQDPGAETEYKEAVINFNKSGVITAVYFSIDDNNYKSIMDKGVQLDDMERRLEILDYVERFRTSYNQKDLNFLKQVFSDDALIITGRVIKPRKSKKGDGMTITFPKVEYTKQNKSQYIAKLERTFANNKYLNVTFDDVEVKRHGSNPNIYGVRVIQHWNTRTYSDEGYVYMVWDFTNPKQPQIHVRTWQPMYLDDAKRKPMPKDEVFDLKHFQGI